MKSMAKLEIERYPWTKLREVAGMGQEIPGALLSLIEAPTPERAEEAYWRLENHVVVQGQLFETAEFVVPVIFAALLEADSRHVKISLLELLFQIVSGESHQREIDQGNSDLGDRCRMRAREGLWVLYWETMYGERAAALDVLEKIEIDRKRFSHFRDLVLCHEGEMT